MTRQSQLSVLESKIAAEPHNSKVAIWEDQIKNLKQKANEPRKTQTYPKRNPRPRRRNNRRNNMANRTRQITQDGIQPRPVPGASSKLNVPSYILDATTKERMQLAEIADRYPKVRLDALLNFLCPDTHQARFPDKVDVETNLLRSIIEFDLPVLFDGTENAGRYSFAYHTGPGNTDSLNNWKVQLVNPQGTGGGWPTNFANQDNYIQSIGKLDLRVDQSIAQLNYRSCGQGVFSSASTNYTFLNDQYDGFPFRNVGGIADVPNFDNIGIEVQSVASSLSAAPYNAGTVPPTLQNAYRYNIPGGVYSFDWYFWLENGLLSVAPFGANFVMFAFDNTSNQCLGKLELSAVGSPGILASGYFMNRYDVIVQERGDFISPNQTTATKWNVNIIVTSNVYFVPVILARNAASYNGQFHSGLIITTVEDPRLAVLTNGGKLDRLRPLGCSVLFTPITSSFTTGGHHVAVSVPGGYVKEQYARDREPQLQIPGNLARNNKGSYTYDGNVDHGSYTFVQPSENDLLMRSLDEAGSYSYPGIIVSGQFANSAGLTSGYTNIARVRIITTYEFTTSDLLWTPQQCVGSADDGAAVLTLLGSSQHSMVNNRHLDKLNRFVKDSVGFLEGTIPTIVKGISLMKPLM